VASLLQVKSNGTASVLINNLDSENMDKNTCKKGMIYLNSSTHHFYNVVTGKKCATLGNPAAIDTDSLLMDVDVQSIDDNPPTHEDKWQDVDQFFHPAVGVVWTQARLTSTTRCKATQTVHIYY
jgi:hypothetical protein